MTYKWVSFNYVHIMLEDVHIHLNPSQVTRFIIGALALSYVNVFIIVETFIFKDTLVKLDLVCAPCP